MAMISAAVGRSGTNKPDDVKTVQSLLNKQRPVPLRQITVDGASGPETVSAVEEFQKRVVKLPWPDGRVDPLGKTWNALSAGDTAASKQTAPATGEKTTSTAVGGNLSGAAWWRANQAKYPNSNSLEDLETDFRGKVKDFVAAMREGGATVTVSSTKRNRLRAYLMHYCHKIANGKIHPSKVPAEAGVDIAWDHGDDAASKKGAQEMVNLFNIAYAPSLTSRHIEAKAIDMTITWSGTLKVKNKQGVIVHIDAPRNGNDNTTLHAVGATYGVKKLASDPPHWSTDGH